MSGVVLARAYYCGSSALKRCPVTCGRGQERLSAASLIGVSFAEAVRVVEHGPSRPALIHCKLVSKYIREPIDTTVTYRVSDFAFGRRLRGVVSRSTRWTMAARSGFRYSFVDHLVLDCVGILLDMVFRSAVDLL